MDKVLKIGIIGCGVIADFHANALFELAADAEIAGVAVKQQKDYKDGSVVETATGARSQMELTGSNVLRYEMADGTSLIVRPSGTEPKVKLYVNSVSDSAAQTASDLTAMSDAAVALLNSLI